jgi:FAD/FMN-containing dehydrogenase
MTTASTVPSATTSTTLDTRAASLRGLCAGAIHLPGGPGYDEARMPWNVAVDQRPAAVAYPGSAEEVSAVVRAAAAVGLRVAPQGTGHNAGPLGSLEDVVLLRTSAMTAVTIDAERQIARVEAGALWLDAVEPAAGAGLAALHGSSPDVGIVGYSLGGGLGWYARKLGLATNSITAVELVIGDGSLIRADEENHPELFWALRGGGGSFGVVTALEFRLYPIETAYGGMLAWDQKHAEKVLRRWAEWSVDAPDEVTTSFRLLNVPPMPDIPEQFRGRQLVVIDGAVLDTDERAAEILAPLRELEPEIDMFGRMPAAGLVRIHMDPEGPTPATSATSMLDALPEEAIKKFVATAGPESGSSLLLAELRQLGGALSRPHPGAGALPRLEGQFILFAAAIAATPELEEQGYADAVALNEAMKPFASDRNYLNFAEKPVDVSSGYDAETWRKLAGIRSAVDPKGVFLANHPVPRLYENGQPTT